MPGKLVNVKYKIFPSEECDWYVAAKCDSSGKVTVLYEGHHLQQAYESIFEDMGKTIPKETRDMEELDTYKPTKEDFE